MELSLADMFTAGGLATLLQVILIDLTLAGDNVVIMGTIASGLPAAERKRVIMLGVGFALAFLVGFAFLATWLLTLPGLMLAGGLALVWIGGGMAWELWSGRRADGTAPPRRERTFLHAAVRIMLADLSMSLDNVLAVAAAARAHPTVLLFGMVFSVTIMGVAANFVARLIECHRWIAWVGVLIILFVAARMVVDGTRQVAPLLGVEL